jgi:hypothetical protein
MATVVVVAAEGGGGQRRTAEREERAKLEFGRSAYRLFLLSWKKDFNEVRGFVSAIITICPISDDF